MLYFVNDNYKTTRPVILSFEELMDKATRDHFACASFIMVGEFKNFTEALKAFNESDISDNSRYYHG